MDMVEEKISAVEKWTGKIATLEDRTIDTVRDLQRLEGNVPQYIKVTALIYFFVIYFL